MQNCLQIDLLKWLSDTSQWRSCSAASFSLVSFHSIQHQAKKKLWKKGVIAVHARGLSSKEISAHFRCPFQSPLFHLSQTISPPWWFPSPFFCALPLRWCTSCQGQRDVFVRRRLGIKTNTTSHRRQCLNVLRLVCTGPRWWRKRITYDRRVFIMDREKRWRKPGQSPHPLLQEPNPRRKHLINIQFVRGVHFFWVCPCPRRRSVSATGRPVRTSGRAFTRIKSLLKGPEAPAIWCGFNQRRDSFV